MVDCLGLRAGGYLSSALCALALLSCGDDAAPDAAQPAVAPVGGTGAAPAGTSRANAGTQGDGASGAPEAGTGAGAAGATGGTGSAAEAGTGMSGSGGQSGGTGPAPAEDAGDGSAGASAATCPQAPAASAGETTLSIMVGDRMRSYVRRTPSGYTGQTPLPVVIDFHPLGGSAASWKNATGWPALADEQGIIMVWPDGVENSWNIGRCCRGAFEQNVDDVGFAKAIVAALQQDVCIDPKRVYATGCSNGGGMAFKVACDAADVIAAVAPVDFDCATNTEGMPSCGMCDPARPISQMQFRGTADALVPYEGGIRAGGSTHHGGAQQTLAEWGAINMCGGEPEPAADEPSCETYPSCAGGVETTLCTVQNGSHCGSYQSFQILEKAWAMFQRHSLP